eukprot:Nitzschia sp. Nitz4//scaffold22_size323478//12652//14143//NITZ4_000491-RA/size323478-augustus-gene-0.192-mRNA-1//1//CDS//3329542887//1543//frame0
MKPFQIDMAAKAKRRSHPSRRPDAEQFAPLLGSPPSGGSDVTRGIKSHRSQTIRTRNRSRNDDEEGFDDEYDDQERVPMLSGAPRRRRATRRLNPMERIIASILDIPRHWTFKRLVRYLSLTAIAAMVTMILTRPAGGRLNMRSASIEKILNPSVLGRDRCYRERHMRGQEQSCTCPDPTKPLYRSDKRWEKQHNNMLAHAKSSKDLDIVFLGDSIAEQWNGTQGMGNTVIPGMREPFESHFTIQGGGKFEGLALGCAGDLGPNVLWHLENGLARYLNPKFWFVSLGTNELFLERCVNSLVIASVFNVVEYLLLNKPDSYVIIHGILPRREDPNSDSGELKEKWQAAHTLNAQIRKFSEKSTRLYFMQAAPLFLKAQDPKYGRKQINQALLDGVRPTQAGLEVWGDYIVKRLQEINAELDRIAYQQEKGAARALPSNSTYRMEHGF